MKDLLNKTVYIEDNIRYETKLHWVSYINPIISIFVTLFIYLAISKWIVEPFVHHKSFYIIEEGKVVEEFTELQSFFRWIVRIFFIYLITKMIYSIFYLNTIKIYLTEKSLTLKQGIFSKRLTDISLSKYEGMGLHQSLLGRILGYGTLSITTGGASQSYKIEEPMKLRGYILKLIK